MGDSLSQPTTASERDQIVARLSDLQAKQEAATSWGAAVGAREEEIRSLESRLLRIDYATAPPSTETPRHTPGAQTVTEGGGMGNRISTDIYILSQRDLDDREQRAFQSGIVRGAFEERIKIGKEPVAFNCANWKDGRCELCGAQHQGMEVGGEYKCPHFIRRAKP